jgi:hypothetical protein
VAYRPLVIPVTRPDQEPGESPEVLRSLQEELRLQIGQIREARDQARIHMLLRPGGAADNFPRPGPLMGAAPGSQGKDPGSGW